MIFSSTEWTKLRINILLIIGMSPRRDTGHLTSVSPPCYWSSYPCHGPTHLTFTDPTLTTINKLHICVSPQLLLCCCQHNNEIGLWPLCLSVPISEYSNVPTNSDSVVKLYDQSCFMFKKCCSHLHIHDFQILLERCWVQEPGSVENRPVELLAGCMLHCCRSYLALHRFLTLLSGFPLAR